MPDVPSAPPSSAAASAAASSSSAPTPPTTTPRHRSSRKNRHLVVPADTLLSFSRYTPTAEVTPRQKRTPVKAAPRSRDHFVQANYRFVVDPTADLLAACSHPNLPIPWPAIDIVFLPSLPPCPICLDVARVPRLTPCGHVFDAVCLSQHVAHAHAASRPARCPLCADRLIPDLLKPCLPTVPPSHTPLDSDDDIHIHLPFTPTLRLISRPRGSVLAHAHPSPSHEHAPILTKRSAFFARFAYPTATFLLDEISREDAELVALLAEQPELSAFIAVARAELAERAAAVRARPPLPEGATSTTPTLPTSSDALSHVDFKPNGELHSNTEKKIENVDSNEDGKREGMTEGDKKVESDADTDISTTLSERNAERGSGSGSGSGSRSGTARRKPARWFYYQADDASNVFLHPVSHRCLTTEFGSNLSDVAPTTLSDFPVLQHDRLVMDDATRKRYRFLDHLPDGCEFVFVELDVTSLLSTRTLAIHEQDLRDRRALRRKKELASARENRIVQRRETETMQQYVSSLGGRGGDVMRESVDSRDVHSFPALRVDTETSDVTEVDTGGTFPVEQEVTPASPNRHWGAEVSSYSSVTSNMGLFPALTQVAQRDVARSDDTVFPALGQSPRREATVLSGSPPLSVGLQGAWRPATSTATATRSPPATETANATASATESGTGSVAVTRGTSVSSTVTDVTSNIDNSAVGIAVPSGETGTDAWGGSRTIGNRGGSGQEEGRKGRRSRGKSTTIVLSNARSAYRR